MQVYEILSSTRVIVDTQSEGVTDKPAALRLLGELIGPSLGQPGDEISRLLSDRERLGSTGIGDGVAIPHASMPGIRGRVGALVLCRRGVEFESIDGLPASIILGVVGPTEATGEHLRVLARASRLLRDVRTRQALLGSASAADAMALIEARADG